jgi:hypothetical protein
MLILINIFQFYIKFTITKQSWKSDWQQFSVSIFIADKVYKKFHDNISSGYASINVFVKRHKK